MRGTAVKVTGVPWQTGFMEGVTDTLTGSIWPTFIVIMFEVAGLPVAQAAFDIRWQITASPSWGMYE